VQRRVGALAEEMNLGRGFAQNPDLHLRAALRAVQIYCQGVAPKTATGTSGTLSPSDVADFGTKFDVQATPGQTTRP